MNKNYENNVKEKLYKLSYFIYDIQINFNYDIDTQIYSINGKILFIDGSKLMITERYSDLKHRYRFHYMDNKNNLISRWDNAPHYKNLNSFPHHQHLPNDIIESEDVNILDTIGWIIRQINLF